MTRTAPPRTPSLPPCMLAPELWDSSDNTEAIAACRQQCPRRFACAQEALAGPKHLVSSLNGVIAGVAIPEQNEYGTSKAHKAALKRLETIAELGAAASVATQHCARSQQTATPADRDDARTSSADEPSGEDQKQSGAYEPTPTADQVDLSEVVILPRGWHATRTPGATKVIPEGQVDIHGAARITGLAEQTLRDFRRTGAGPKSWLIPGGRRGRLRYRVADIEDWMAQRQPRPTGPVARAS